VSRAGNPNSPCSTVTIELPAASYAVIVLSQLDERYFQALQGQASWTFDFVLFKKGETEPIGVSLTNRPSPRSVNLEIDLPKGDYVVHVRLDRQLDAHVGFTDPFLGFIDYFFPSCIG
jgi:hypothetical protein